MDTKALLLPVFVVIGAIIVLSLAPTLFAQSLNVSNDSVNSPAWIRTVLPFVTGIVFLLLIVGFVKNRS